MFIRKLAILPAALIALGLTVGVPAESFAQSNKPAATKKSGTSKKKATKKAAKKKAADLGQVRTFA